MNNSVAKRAPNERAEPRVGVSLQQKAWMITAGVLAALAALLAIGIDGVFRKSFSRMEEQWVQESVRRVDAAILTEMEGLERSSRDYATWTETYEFMTDATRPYVANNLSPATFTNLQIDAFLLFDAEGTLRLGRTFADGEVTEEGVENLAAALAESARSTFAAGPTTGFVRMSEHAALFAALPILRDDGSGPSRGSLVQVRFLDPERIARLQRSINLPISLEQPAVATGAPAVRGAEASFRREAASDRLLIVSVPVRDVTGKMIGEWRLQLAREIHLQGIKARIVFYGVMLVVIAAAALLIGRLLRSMVIARLEALHQAVDRVGATSDLSLRLPLVGSDELTRLASGINQMLARLEQAESERTAGEEERLRLNAQLQQAQKLEAIGTLAGGLAHDFNNLLTSIQGSTTLLRLDSPPAPSAEPNLRRIEQAAAQAAGLVRQMMAFGRRSPAAFAHIHLAEVVREALQLLRPSIPRGISFHFRDEAVNDLVYADAGQLQQVIVNLATNASHAMAGGVGDLTVHISEVRLPLSSRPETAVVAEGPYLQLVVSDTGCGIPAENIPRIFEPFYTTKPVGSGTGLGLAVVHGIITHHYGVIGVQSVPGSGTGIYIHLPQAQPELQTPEPSVKTSTDGTSRNGARLRVLLVDDDQMVRETLEAAMRRNGYDVEIASGAVHALKIVRENRKAFDVVVTDQMMPGMTGTELREVMAKERPEMTMILMTGFASALNESKVKALGFSAMLMKPVSMQSLDETLRTVCLSPRD